MRRNLSTAIGFFAALTVLSPANAQVHVRADVPLPPLPHVEIHVAHSAPPPLRIEHAPPRPGRHFVWVRGWWDWRGDDWAWVPGRWEQPHHGSSWVRARYVRVAPGYWRYEPAHWRGQRLVESDDYIQWRNEHHHSRDRD